MSRFCLCLLLASTATSSWADDFSLSSAVTAATIYPQGASITRDVPFDIPAGAHRLIIADLPINTPLADLRVTIDGATIKNITSRNAFVPPRDETQTQAYKAAEDHLEQVQDKLRQAEADVETIRLERRAALTRVQFLESLGKSETQSYDPADLREVVTLVGDETLSALKAAQAAEQRADAADRALKDLREEEQNAAQALEALVSENTARAMVAIALETDDDLKGTAQITYRIDAAAWQPVYDFMLDREGESLKIERGAMVAQNTGENWTNVALQLSTRRPSEKTEPSEIWPQTHRIYDPKESERNDSAMKAESVPIMARPAPVLDMGRVEPVAAEPATPEFEAGGLSVTYKASTPVSVASGADFSRVDLDVLTMPAEIFARAVPLGDETAYLMASFTNGQEPILPTDEATLLVDGHYVGKRAIELVAAGDKADMSFGAIEGLRLKRHILDKQEGDRGFISKSNELTENVLIEVENLTDQSWPVRVLDRVPVSQQEDLTIEWSSAPKPTDQDVDQKKGVLRWVMTLDPGDKTEITLDYTLDWPDGQVLQ